MLEFIQNLAVHSPYTIVFGALLIAGLGLPMPEDIPLVVGGFLCGEAIEQGRMSPNIVLMLLGAFSFILIGDLITFYLGRFLGPSINNHPFILRVIGGKNIERAKQLCQDKGIWFVFMARYLPGIRSPAFFAAGMLKMRLRWFLLGDGLAALISVPIIVLGAFYFHNNIKTVLMWVKQGQRTGIVIVICVILALILWKIILKRLLFKK